MNEEFTPFPKIFRLTREVIVTEKIDGTNASVWIDENGSFKTASRTRWITPDDDNFGFSAWAYTHKDNLMELGPGAHFGEWWGSGIQRGYGLTKGERRFSLFNVSRWAESRPACCDVVPTLGRFMFDTAKVEQIIDDLQLNGSKASPGFMRPEGVIVFHVAGSVGFKKTIERDEEPKGKMR